MTNDPILWIAEIGNNHNGDLQRAKRLINHAKDIGCNIAKFQLRDYDALYRDSLNSVEDLGVEYTQDLLKKYELPFTAHVELSAYCDSIGIEYMCTPWDEPSVELLEELNVKRYKVASADFDNIPLINKLAKTQKPIILSTGMATIEDIKERSSYLKEIGADFSLLHCNSTYPAPFEDIELNVLREISKYSLIFGYSGHERGIAVSLGAIALGSKIIERHLTEDKNLEGPDHEASLLPHEFKDLVSSGQELTLALGQQDVDQRKLSQGTLLNKEVLGKSIVAKFGMAAGHTLSGDDVAIKSPGQGLPPTKLKEILGRKLKKPIKKDEFILHSHFNDLRPVLGPIDFQDLKWGIPVRPHDVKQMHEIFHAPVYEFHVSYNDLERGLPNEDWEFLKENQILVHAPELFKDSRLLDLCDIENKAIHRQNLNRVCEFAREIRSKSKNTTSIKIITNIGGFSTHSFRTDSEKADLYSRVAEGLDYIDETNCEITIQNMAPFPWHFGGQRYQNIFADPKEIAAFCQTYNRRITLDTAHLSMYCKYQTINFQQSISLLGPHTTHWHMSDSQGTNGEGVQMGTGDVDFSTTMSNVDANQTFIVETWQGHKNYGAGFREDLKYLESEANGLK